MLNIKNWLLKFPAVYNFVTNILSGSYDRLDAVVRAETAVEKDNSIFEIACGTGHFCPTLKDFKYFGMDISLDYVRFAEKGNPNGGFFCGDAQHLPIRDGIVDTVLFVGFFHHADDALAGKVLEEAKRITKKAGKILVIDAIWPTNKFNIIAGMIRSLDIGKYVRTHKEYVKLFDVIGVKNEKSYTFGYGVGLECGVYVLRSE